LNLFIDARIRTGGSELENFQQEIFATNADGCDHRSIQRHRVQGDCECRRTIDAEILALQQIRIRRSEKSFSFCESL